MKPLVLIPSYNPGPALHRVVADALPHGLPLWVVSDGSTDQSHLTIGQPGVRLIVLPQNHGKGEAVRQGLIAAAPEAFTHALVMDADGQHPAHCIPGFIAASEANPDAMILGNPQFGPDAPAIRVLGRRAANLATRLAAPGANIADALFGFRVYPIAPLLHAFAATRHMRGFDFEPEAAIRLARLGVPVINRPAPVRYFRREQGGVSHFRYVADNIKLVRMYARLLT